LDELAIITKELNAIIKELNWRNAHAR
jgi:hypothetical protein